MPIAKLPSELNSGAEFNRVAEVFAFAGSETARRKSGSKQEVIKKKKIEIETDVAVKSPFCRSHDSNERAEFEVSIGRFEPFDVEFIFDLEFKGAVFFSI